MAKKTEMTDAQKRALSIAKQITSGCPLMEGRTKADVDDYVGEELVIADAYPMNGESRYYCVTIEGDDGIFFMSGGGLTSVLEAIYKDFDEDLEVFREAVAGITFRFEKKKKTKNNRTFRPVTIL